MTGHIFVDESKEKGYLLAAATIASECLGNVRKAVRQHVMPGQRRIHFRKESDRRRSGFLDTLSQFPIGAAIYEVTSRPLPKDARMRCLGPLVDDVLAASAQRLVIETDDAVVRHDRTLLYAKVGHHKGTVQLRYDHLRSHEECLLWIPDAVAWCWSRGGIWRSRVKKLITTVRVL